MYNQPPDMNSIDNSNESGMTPVLIPINSLGYPNRRFQYNSGDPIVNQTPFDNDPPRNIVPREAPLTSRSSIDSSEEDNTSIPETLHLSSTTTTESTTVTTESTTSAIDISTTTASPNVSGSGRDSSELPEVVDKNYLSNANTSSQENRKNHDLNKQPSRNIKREANSNNKNEEKLSKESAIINKQPQSYPLVFPDHVNQFRKNAEQKRKPNDFPNRFSEGPQVLYAVSIAPSLTSQYNGGSNAHPATSNVPSQSNAPLTNSPSYNQNAQYTNQPTYVWQNANQALTSNMPSTVQNTIALPNQNGGTTLYSVVNLPTTNTYVPNQVQYPATNINAGNYQTVSTNGLNNGSPYYVVSQPNQNTQQQNTEAVLPYNNAPMTYTVGYVSSNGQTILVPSNAQVYQLSPQTNYVPESNGQDDVMTLTSAPSNTITLPENTDTVTLLSYKDKIDSKPKDKNSNDDYADSPEVKAD
ncbi:homeobox protein 9-like [Zerene cesonia]|uniref:homeobox protein 9-like n=1 Tax=Zerene cesonia TaxID=33412 RepID=UPI0018E52780|nr:homeobox protein 9-like [Zerene cesonia]